MEINVDLKAINCSEANQNSTDKNMSELLDAVEFMIKDSLTGGSVSVSTEECSSSGRSFKAVIEGDSVVFGNTAQAAKLLRLASTADIHSSQGGRIVIELTFITIPTAIQ